MSDTDPDPWAADDDDQTTFADLFDTEERKAWAKRRRCKHCFVWGFDEARDKFFIACAHGCGSIRHIWTSPDPAGDLRRVKATQEAFAIAHAYGCPRDSERGATRVKPWTKR